MLTYVKLRNFMSFGEVEFNFKKNKKSYKKFAAIYGENGSGKSNFVQSIDFLLKTIQSMDWLKRLQAMEGLLSSEKMNTELLESLLFTVDLTKTMQEIRMIGCKSPTFVEYGFTLNGHEGYYRIEFSQTIESEKLYYFTGKQSGEIFNIKNINGEIDFKFTNKLFLDNYIKEDFVNLVKQYWGKHTFLSILQKETKEKNDQYISNGILKYLIDVLEMFRDIFVVLKKSSFRSGIGCNKPYDILDNLLEGECSKKDISILDKTERILCTFFTQAYADIKNVYYEKQYTDDLVHYNLFVDKIIAGEIRSIDFKKESAGTRQILVIFRALLAAICGATVIYDEIDDGIHDLLFKNIIDSIKDEISGQLIITTHNTLLLESIDIKSAYIISIDYLGNKEVKCLDSFPRIQQTNNPRTMYLKGLFGGVPFSDYIDFEEIVSSLTISETE